MPLKITEVGQRNSNIENDLLTASKTGIMSRIVNVSVNYSVVIEGT